MDHLSRIDIFIAVVKQASFAGAARELGITSSAVSKQIQNLEHELRVKLLNRTTRRVSVTEEGAIYFERASRALEDLKEAQDYIHDMKASPRGPLKVSVPMSFGLKYLAESLAVFARQYPDVALDIHFDDRVVDMVQDGFDVAVRIGLLQDSTMIARKLAPCPVHVCASAEYFARCGRPQTPADLARHNVLAYTRNRGAHEWRFKDPQGVEGHVGLSSSFKCDTGDMMVEAARQGIGIVILPEFFVREAIESGALETALGTYTTWPERNIYAVFQPNRYLSTRLRLLVEHLSQTCEKLCEAMAQCPKI